MSGGRAIRPAGSGRHADEKVLTSASVKGPRMKIFPAEFARRILRRMYGQTPETAWCSVIGVIDVIDVIQVLTRQAGCAIETSHGRA